MTRGPIDVRLQTLVDDDIRAHPEMPGRMLHVLAPSLGVDWEGAGGWADVRTREPLTPGSRFRIASVTKTFVGAAALRLVEDGRLELEGSIAQTLPEEYVEVLRAGGYEPATITLRHLLTHTSGIYDFAASAYDPAIDGGYDHAIAADPRHRWTRLEQVRLAMERGRPYGAPGEVYAYSDTGACLVGEILEQVTGLGMGAAIRDLVGFERLGLRHTYLESIDPDPPDLPPLAHQYEGEIDVIDLDPSVDLYGGGGLVSTCGDLARFLRALLGGDVFREPATLVTMTTLSTGVPATPASPTADVGLTEDPDSAAMYLYRIELAGEVFWGHGGWWGTTAFTCPRLDVTVVAGHNQAHMPDPFDRYAIVERALRALF